ncbi:hypothetical protein PMIN06_000410 [Paraphaeosphaeria minitans]
MVSLTEPFTGPIIAPPLTPSKSDPQVPFVSDGDILCAPVYPPYMSRPVYVMLGATRARYAFADVW